MLQKAYNDWMLEYTEKIETMTQNYFDPLHISKWVCRTIKQQFRDLTDSAYIIHYCRYCDCVKNLHLHLRFMCILSCLSLTSTRARPIKLTFMDMCSSILSPTVRTDREDTDLSYDFMASISPASQPAFSVQINCINCFYLMEKVLFHFFFLLNKTCKCEELPVNRRS